VNQPAREQLQIARAARTITLQMHPEDAQGAQDGAGFAHATTKATLANPSHSDRLGQSYVAGRSIPHWPPLERILEEKVICDGTPPDPALRNYNLLITILMAFLEAADQKHSPQSPPFVMGFAGIVGSQQQTDGHR